MKPKRLTQKATTAPTIVRFDKPSSQVEDLGQRLLSLVDRLRTGNKLEGVGVRGEHFFVSANLDPGMMDSFHESLLLSFAGERSVLVIVTDNNNLFELRKEGPRRDLLLETRTKIVTEIDRYLAQNPVDASLFPVIDEHAIERLFPEREDSGRANF